MCYVCITCNNWIWWRSDVWITDNKPYSASYHITLYIVSTYHIIPYHTVLYRRSVTVSPRGTSLYSCSHSPRYVRCDTLHYTLHCTWEHTYLPSTSSATDVTFRIQLTICFFRIHTFLQLYFFFFFHLYYISNLRSGNFYCRFWQKWNHSVKNINQHLESPRGLIQVPNPLPPGFWPRLRIFFFLLTRQFKWLQRGIQNWHPSWVSTDRTYIFSTRTCPVHSYSTFFTIDFPHLCFLRVTIFSHLTLSHFTLSSLSSSILSYWIVSYLFFIFVSNCSLLCSCLFSFRNFLFSFSFS